MVNGGDAVMFWGFLMPLMVVVWAGALGAVVWIVKRLRREV